MPRAGRPAQPQPLDFRTTRPPYFTAASLARCHAVLQGTHDRCGLASVLRTLPMEIVQQICMAVREPIDDHAYHFMAHGDEHISGQLDLWLIVQRRHKRHDRVPSATRVVLQHAELPDSPRHTSSPSQQPVVTRMLGHYEGFSGRALLVRWTHRVESIGLELCEWPAACTADELRAPCIAEPSRRSSLRDRSRTTRPTLLCLSSLSHTSVLPLTCTPTLTLTRAQAGRRGQSPHARAATALSC